MTKDTTKNKVTVDGVEYKLDEISENAKAQLNNIHFVDSQIQQPIMMGYSRHRKNWL